MNLEAAPIDRSPEIFLELEAPEGPGKRTRTEHLVSFFGPLGPIQSRVRVPKEVERPCSVTSTQGDSHAGGDVNFVLGDDERLAQGPEEALWNWTAALVSRTLVSKIVNS
jgi:hypothetical protein